jgi:hypothetical protein
MELRAENAEAAVGVAGPILMTENGWNRKLRFVVMAAGGMVCLVWLFRVCIAPAPVRLKLLTQPTRGGDARAWFQLENQRNQPVEVEVFYLEERHGSEWRSVYQFPWIEVLGGCGEPWRKTWSVPAQTTNVFFCRVPSTEVAYRLNLECRLGGRDPSHLGNRLRNYLANLVWLSCRQVGAGMRAVPQSKSKLMHRLRGEPCLVTETFQARSPEQAGNAGVFALPLTSVNAPDPRNVPLRMSSIIDKDKPLARPTDAQR